MSSTNSISLSKIKGALVFFYFILRGVPLEGILSNNLGASIGTYVLVLGLFLFTLPALWKKNATLPFIFFYLFGVIFLITFSFAFLDNLTSEGSSLGLYFEYVLSISVVILIYFTFQSDKDIDWFFKALIYSSLTISLYWGIFVILNPDGAWRIGAIGGTGATFNTVSYQIVAAAWAGPMVNLLKPNRLLRLKISRDIPLLLLLTFGNFLTGTKGGVVLEFGLLGMLLFMGFKEGGNKMNAISFCKQFVFIILVPITVLYFTVRQLGGGLEAINRIFFGFQSAHAFDARIQMLLYAKDQILDDLPSLFFGSGFGAFNLDIGGGSGVTAAKYPHNLFLDLAFNAGLPAAILLAIWMVHIWVFIIKLTKQQNQDPFQRQNLIKTVGWGVVACFSALTVFKFSSNTMLWFFFALAIRIRQNLLTGKSNKRKNAFDY